MFNTKKTSFYRAEFGTGVRGTETIFNTRSTILEERMQGLEKGTENLSERTESWVLKNLWFVLLNPTFCLWLATLWLPSLGLWFLTPTNQLRKLDALNGLNLIFWTLVFNQDQILENHVVFLYIYCCIHCRMPQAKLFLVCIVHYSCIVHCHAVCSIQDAVSLCSTNYAIAAVFSMKYAICWM